MFSIEERPFAERMYVCMYVCMYIGVCLNVEFQYVERQYVEKILKMSNNIENIKKY
jgi:hypothetical protein